MRSIAGTARLLALAALVSLVGVLPLEAGTRVEHSVLRAMFPGTFSVRVNGIPATFVARGGGSLLGKAVIGSDSGRWSIRNGRLCIMLRNLYRGESRCSAVNRDGDWYQTRDFVFRKL
jgi:hypothetical protein